MFVARDYDVSIWVKLHNYSVGRSGRKDLLRKFCADNGIDYRPKQGHKYHLPENYLIEHKELDYLSDIRDKLILNFYDDYRDAQNDNLTKQNSYKSRIESQNKIIEDCKARLKKNQGFLRRVKTPIDQIHYENVVASIKTRIQNEKQDKNMLENSLSALETEFKANLQNWNKQVEIIEKLLNIRCKNFEKNISKQIRKKLNFADFHSQFNEYSDEVKKILKGELYV